MNLKGKFTLNRNDADSSSGLFTCCRHFPHGNWSAMQIFKLTACQFLFVQCIVADFATDYPQICSKIQNMQVLKLQISLLFCIIQVEIWSCKNTPNSTKICTIWCGLFVDLMCTLLLYVALGPGYILEYTPPLCHWFTAYIIYIIICAILWAKNIY